MAKNLNEIEISFNEISFNENWEFNILEIGGYQKILLETSSLVYSSYFSLLFIFFHEIYFDHTFSLPQLLPDPLHLLS